MEIKEASKSFTVSLKYIDRLYKTAVRQGKSPLLILRIGPYDIDMTIQRRTQG